MNYKPNLYSLKEKSEYHKKIAAMNIKPEEKTKKICRKHPTSYWGKKKDGTWYEKCFRGFNENEPCEELTD